MDDISAKEKNVAMIIDLFPPQKLVMEDRCPDCGAWHEISPLEHLEIGESCGHDRNRPCNICGKPVGNLSTGGSAVCATCDSGWM